MVTDHDRRKDVEEVPHESRSVGEGGRLRLEDE